MKGKVQGSTILLPVFIPAVAIILLLVIGTISDPELAGEAFSSTLAWITQTFGWFYMLSVAIFLVFIVSVAASGWGNIKLGPDHAEAQYSFPEWFSMLFSAGYGVALLYFGVAEPVLHYSSPPAGAAETVDAAKQAMQIAFFHWGFHIWAIYGLVGLVLAYFAFRHGLPLSIRSALYPLIGDKIYGPIGHAVDVFAILGTLFGIATTLGLSVTQINAGLNYLSGDIPIDIMVQVGTIAIVTIAATISVIAGMDKGIKRLSIINMLLAVSLMSTVFIMGETIHILETFLQNTGSYISGIVERTFNLQAYSRSDWIGNWTLFIFGWTIRQFVFGVMLVPTIFTFLWFSVFGDTALNAIMNQGVTTLISDVQENEAVALFKLYDLLPGASIMSGLTVLLIITFFVTSSDSGSLVIDSLASGGLEESPVWQRIFWAFLEGTVAAVLLLAGGLNALQTMTIASALPFAFIMLIAAAGLWRALVIEGYRNSSLQANTLNRNRGRAANLKGRLAAMVEYPSRDVVHDFIKNTVTEAMRDVQSALKAREWKAHVEFDEDMVRATFTVERHDHMDFIYDIRITEYLVPGFSYAEVRSEDDESEKYYRAEVFLRRGGQAYDIYGYEKESIAKDILDQFESYLHFLDTSPGELPWEMDAYDDMLQKPER